LLIELGAGEHALVSHADQPRNMLRDEPCISRDELHRYAESGERGQRLRRTLLGLVQKSQKAVENQTLLSAAAVTRSTGQRSGGDRHDPNAATGPIGEVLFESRAFRSIELGAGRQHRASIVAQRIVSTIAASASSPVAAAMIAANASSSSNGLASWRSSTCRRDRSRSSRS
jgi:hypothetical protein